MSNLHYLRIVNGLNRNARLFLLHSLLSGLSLALLSLLYNLYILSLGFHQDMIGLVTLVACLTAVLAALPLGLVLNRLGYRRALALGAAGAALSIALPLAIPSAEVLIATELVWGVGFTLLIVAGGPFMTENSSEAERAHLFSLQFVVTMLTAFAGNLIGGELPSRLGAWLGAGPQAPEAYRGALALSAGLMLLAAIPVLFLRSSERRGSAVRPRLRLAHRGGVVRLLTPYVLGAFAAGLFVPFTNVLWKTTQGLSDSGIGAVFALSALVVAGAGLFAPAVTRRCGAVRLVVVAQGAAVVGLLMFGFSPWLGLALVGYLGRDVLLNLTRPVFGQFMMDETIPAERAAVSALATMGFNLAWGASSWVSGEWQTAGQLPWVFFGSAALYLGSTFTLQWFYGWRNRMAMLEKKVHAAGVAAE